MARHNAGRYNINGGGETGHAVEGEKAAGE